MARVWPIDPAIPSLAIEQMKDDVAEVAAELFSKGRDVEDHQLMALAEDLNAWAVTLERMAVSSPSYHGALGRSFADHPRHDENLDDRLVPARAQADLLAFIAIGDLTLNRLGRLWMRALGTPLDREEEGFAAFLRACDGNIDLAASHPARRLQVSLRSARNRLLAHVRPDHAEIRAWARDETPDVTLVGLAPPADLEAAAVALKAELGKGAATWSLDHPRDYIAAVAANAPFLTSRELWALDRAMRTVGYVSLSVADTVRDVLSLAKPLQPVAGGFDFDPRDLVDA